MNIITEKILVQNQKNKYLCLSINNIIYSNMPKFISPEGVEFPSKIAYYRTIEDQGSKNTPEFIQYMNRKYDIVEKEKYKWQCREINKKRYHTDNEYRKNKNKAKLNRYHNDDEYRNHIISVSLGRYYKNKTPKLEKTTFISVIAN